MRDWAATLRALGDDQAVATAADGLAAAPSPGTRMAAAMALGELGDAAAAPLTHALRDRIAGVRRCALDAPAALGPGVASAHVCVPLLRDPDVDVRCAAVRAVAALAADADGPLRVALADPSPRVRRAVAGHAASLPPATVRSLLGDADAEVRLAAAWSLAGTPRPDALRALMPLTADEAWEVRRAACRAAARAGGRGATAILVPALADPHPTVRAAARNGLAEAFGGELHHVVRDALPDADPRLRRALVYALAGCADADVAPILADAAADADTDVRLAVAVVLRGVGGEAAERALRRLRDDPDRPVREAAAGARHRPRRGGS